MKFFRSIGCGKKVSETFVSRLQNLSLSAIENLYRANDIFVQRGNLSALERRQDQHEALTDFRLLGYFSMLSRDNGCILPRHVESVVLLTKVQK